MPEITRTASGYILSWENVVIKVSRLDAHKSGDVSAIIQIRNPKDNLSCALLLSLTLLRPGVGRNLSMT